MADNEKTVDEATENETTENEKKKDDVGLMKPSMTSLSLYYGEEGSGIGFKQLCMVAISILADCHVACCLFYFVFEASHEGWACTTDGAAAVTSSIADGNETVEAVYIVTNASCGECPRREFNAAYTSPATEFDLVCERRSLGKLMTSAYFIGSIVGSVIGGHLGDRYGRKTLALSMWTLMTLCMTLTSLAPNWQIYAVLRFMTGVGGGPVSGSVMVLCCEYVGAGWRSVVSSQMGFSAGSLLATLLTYLMCYNWRHLTLTMALIMAPIIPIAFWILPESARLLLIQGRVKSAHAQLKKVARQNKMAEPDFALLQRISDEEQTRQVKRKYHSMADLFRGKTMAIKTLIVLLCWLATSFVSFGLKSSISDITGNLYTNSIIGFAGSIPCRFMTILATNSIGRRWCYVIVTSFVTVALVIVAVMESTGAALAFPIATSAVAMVGNAIVDGNWIVVNLFSTELYSTEIRNIAVGVVYMVSRLGASVAPFILLLDTFHKSIPYVIFAVLEVASIVLSLRLTETRNRPLINSIYSPGGPREAEDSARAPYDDTLREGSPRAHEDSAVSKMDVSGNEKSAQGNEETVSL